MNEQLTKQDILEVVQSANADVLEAIQSFSTSVDHRFDRLEGRMGNVEGRLERVEGRLERVEGRLEKVEGKVNRIEGTMVTKDYLDDKLADHGVRYGGLIRQTNEKVGMLTSALVSEGSLSAKAAKAVMSAEPFGRK